MKFMISFTHTKGEPADRIPRWEALSQTEKQTLASRLKDFSTALETEQGTQLVFFDSPGNARTLRLHRDGGIDVNEGPLFNGEESVGGYFMVEVECIEEALEWARRGRWLVGSNEVREIKDVKI